MARTKRAAVVQHIAFEGLDGFAPALAAAGYQVDGANAADGLPDDFADADLLIVLGGPIGAAEDDTYPFLTDELRLIERRLRDGRALMGVCLGAQLIARALGARVYPAREKEIGFGPVSLTAEGRASCLAPFAEAPATLHWHGDAFDLPAGATRLAATDRCENQAFALGPDVVGFQFHPEATGRNIEHWLVGHAVELRLAGADAPEIRREAAALGPALAHKADAVMRGWLAGLSAPSP